MQGKMKLENKFEIEKNEEEHKNNELHRFCRLVDSYKEMGYNFQDAYEKAKEVFGK